jgi:hypothetical protein
MDFMTESAGRAKLNCNSVGWIGSNQLSSVKKTSVGLLFPSGKHTKNYGKSPFSMGKSTINGHFQ